MSGHPLQNGLHVPQIVDQVRKYDDVERLVEIELVYVGVNEPQVRVPLARAPERFVREIDADADRRRQRAQQVSIATAKVQDPLPRADDEAENLGEPAVVVAAPAALASLLADDRIPECDTVAPIVEIAGVRLDAVKFIHGS